MVDTDLEDLKSKDDELQSSINAEVQDRTAQDGVLLSKINTEIEDRATQDDVLQSNLNNETQERNRTINNEIDKRFIDDYALKSQIGIINTKPR